MATNEEIMAVVKKAQAITETPGGMTVEKYNNLTDEEKSILGEWMAKQESSKVSTLLLRTRPVSYGK